MLEEEAARTLGWLFSPCPHPTLEAFSTPLCPGLLGADLHEYITRLLFPLASSWVQVQPMGQLAGDWRLEEREVRVFNHPTPSLPHPRSGDVCLRLWPQFPPGSP